jgi:hypothetical protein
MLVDRFIRQAVDGVPFEERFADYSSQTNWSSAEVVTRGTGACFGEDGFLRPGFSYADFIDYLYSRVVEHHESKQDLQSVMTQAWTVKMAASLIPRGLEHNADFILSLRLHLRYAIFNKVFSNVRPDWRVGRETLKLALKEARKNREAEAVEVMDWDGVLDDVKVTKRLKPQLEAIHIPLAKALEHICNQVIRDTATAYIYNWRVSSELFNQPKPVDSVFDDFAVESQNLANSLVWAIALSSASLAFRLVGSGAFNTLSAIAALWSIEMSFGTMTNVSRHKIRLEERRILFFEKNLDNVKKALLGSTGSDHRKTLPEGVNPFISEIEGLVNRFQRSARYYGSKESNKLDRALQSWKKNYDEPKEIRKFQTLLTSELIVDTYHVNSYLQEDLVAIYKSLADAQSYLRPKDKACFDKGPAIDAFKSLSNFTPILEKSLQRGPIRWGFIKRRELLHWDWVVVLRYLYSLLCRVLGTTGRFAPIERSTKAILDQVEGLSTKCDNLIFRREVRDLKELYWATHESDIASMIFVSSLLGFTASVVFTVARIFSIEKLEQAAFWASVPSTGGALLAIIHFVRKLSILVKLWITLLRKANASQRPEHHHTIRMVGYLTLTQIVLTLMRLSAATAASVALPFSIAEVGYGERIETHMMLPFWIALGALVLVLLSTVLFLVVEYVLRYKLNPRFPALLVESFRDEINALYWVFRRPWNDVDSKQVQETMAWEYVAREFLHIYRFDTVFAADRFGAVLQYIQCSMETEQRSHEVAKDEDETEAIL